jgi:hypothetical protein
MFTFQTGVPAFPRVDGAPTVRGEKSHEESSVEESPH